MSTALSLLSNQPASLSFLSLQFQYQSQDVDVSDIQLEWLEVVGKLCLDVFALCQCRVPLLYRRCVLSVATNDNHNVSQREQQLVQMQQGLKAGSPAVKNTLRQSATVSVKDGIMSSCMTTPTLVQHWLCASM